MSAAKKSTPKVVEKTTEPATLKTAIKQTVKSTSKPAEKAASKPAVKTVANKVAKTISKPAAKVEAPVVTTPTVNKSMINKPVVNKPVVKTTAEKVPSSKPVVSTKAVAVAAPVGVDVLKSYEDTAVFGQDGFDAVVKANAVLVQGVQDINAALFNLVQVSLDTHAATAKKMFACKTVEDVFALQSDVIKAGYDATLAETQKIADLSVKVTEEAAQPITEQVNAAVEKLTKLAA